ncbi:thiol-disulfide oxidoreductase DCC family protein [Phenylobacterium sp.]|uniref:thiol-disulfide oxidoreductase DCC family protein n=1 Tax=Phenylobacterium sp. TaxID=1871053 RepID=UPI002FD88707
MDAPRTADPAKVTVWYDGACPLCRQEVAWLRRRDLEGALDLVDLTASSPTPLPATREALMARFHARDRGGRLVSGAEAFLAVWSATPGLGGLNRLRRIRPLVALLEAAYRLFLRLRPQLQRLARHGEA